MGIERIDNHQEKIIATGIKMVEDGFRGEQELLHSRGNLVRDTLRQRIRDGETLPEATIWITDRYLDGIQNVIPVLQMKGEAYASQITQAAHDSGRILLGIMKCGTMQVTLEDPSISQMYNEFLQEREDVLKFRPSITEQVQEYMNDSNLLEQINTLFQDDPSGFKLLNTVVDQSHNPTSFWNKILPYKPQDFCLAGIRGTAKMYKRTYLVGANSQLGPLPKI